TDPVSQVMLAIPLVFLYEISIIVSKIFQKKT
ncbi:MAG: twin-arginine translocase subunit TatC, partial [Ignavibacteriae bacterium HGW-Ignavibacteriae-3]